MGQNQSIWTLAAVLHQSLIDIGHGQNPQDQFAHLTLEPGRENSPLGIQSCIKQIKDLGRNFLHSFLKKVVFVNN